MSLTWGRQIDPKLRWGRQIDLKLKGAKSTLDLGGAQNRP